MVLDVLPEIDQIPINVVIDFGIAALLGKLPVFLVGALTEQYPGRTAKDFAVDVMLGDERQDLLAEDALATYPGDDRVHYLPPFPTSWEAGTPASSSLKLAMITSLNSLLLSTEF